MAPDIARPMAWAWGAVGAALAAGAIALWLVHDPAVLDQAAALQPPGDPGAELVEARIRAQEDAVRRLMRSIDDLKRATAFEVRDQFRILPNSGSRDEREPNARWYARYNAVKIRLNDEAQRKGVTLDPRLGFSLNERSLPPPDEIPQCLEMLQLVEKTLDIALSAKVPLAKIEPRLGDLRGTLTGPPGRPPLLREFRISLTVQGQLESILEMLHSMAHAKDADDYPLIFCGGSILSENRREADVIPVLTARFEFAGMRFLDAKERGTSTSVSAAADGSGGVRYMARP